ncbi:MAG: hypothetical protein Ta2B_20560 [Termitinemataceae bacterium]|nr:MAG: hypothetical protein Ta2B_20560 [Termitinemataceae bacterium]
MTSFFESAEQNMAMILKTLQDETIPAQTVIDTIKTLVSEIRLSAEKSQIPVISDFSVQVKKIETSITELKRSKKTDFSDLLKLTASLESFMQEHDKLLETDSEKKRSAVVSAALSHYYKQV